MEFYSQLRLNFEPITTGLIHLNESEWNNMIKSFCVRLSSKLVGDILVKKLLEFITKGYIITVSNCDFSYSRAIYPKIKYINSTNILIVVPNVPYFTMVETIDSRICEDTADPFIRNLDNICKLVPSKYELNFDTIHRDYKFLINKTPMTFFISFAHELIHGLRHFERMNLNPSIEEEANTIYGVDGFTLKYIMGSSQYFITENAIRKENGMELRLTHESEEIFCINIPSTYSRQKFFSKEDYYR